MIKEQPTIHRDSFRELNSQDKPLLSNEETNNQSPEQKPPWKPSLGSEKLNCDVGGSCQQVRSYQHQGGPFLEETIHFLSLNSWIPPCVSVKRGKSNYFNIYICYSVYNQACSLTGQGWEEVITFCLRHFFCKRDIFTVLDHRPLQ